MDLETAACFVDDLLDFGSDLGEGNRKEEDPDEEDDENLLKKPPFDSKTAFFQTADGSFPVLGEEELEWLSNQDAFPTLETFDILWQQKPNKDKPNSRGSKHQSPVSVLESSVASCGFRVPVRARSKRRMRRRGLSELSGLLWSSERKKRERNVSAVTGETRRRCEHCLSEKTPQWRTGPLGPKTLCNACGVRYKSGRLVPEYRPASSPSFSSELHSNSHRKVLEMRRLKLKGKG